MSLALCMPSFAIPIKQEASSQSPPELEPYNSSPLPISSNENPISDVDHLRQERSIVFRPLFVYREELAHNNHPVYRRHIVAPYPYDSIAYPEAYPYFPYPV